MQSTHPHDLRRNMPDFHTNVNRDGTIRNIGYTDDRDFRRSFHPRRENHMDYSDEGHTREFDYNKRRKYDEHDDRTSESVKDHRYNSNYSSSQDSRLQQVKERRVPTATLMLRGLSPETTERLILESFPGYWPSQVRLVINRETGDPRGFAFADFNSVEDAVAVMNMYTYEEGGRQLVIDNRIITLEYGDSRAARPVPVARPIRTDWICGQCNTTNFARRTVCFRCNLPKGPGSQDIIGGSGHDSDMPAESSIPSAVLLVRGLLPTTTEEDLREIFRAYAPVKEVRLVLNKTTNLSRCFAFIEFSSIDHATHTLNAAYGLTIGGMQVRLSFARESFHMKANAMSPSVPRPSNLPAEVVSQYAAAALEQAQWSLGNGYGYQQQQQAAVVPTPQPAATPSRPAEPKREWPAPFEQGGLSFVYDSTTGFYYDVDSCFYYDSNMKLYYSSKKEKYFRHTPDTDPPFSVFEPPAPLTDKPSASTDAQTTETKKTNVAPSGSKSMNMVSKPIKISIAAKKQAKEIAKWNQIQKQILPEDSAIQTDVEKNISLPDEKSSKEDKELQQPTLQSEEKKSDGRPVCLICRRQFSSMDILKKHTLMSKLHLENVAKLEGKSENKQEDLTQAPRYRDRAQERRNLHGQDAAPKLIVDVPHGRSEIPHSPQPSVVSHTLIAEKPLDPGSVGSKMLKMMGWKEGEGLGKRRDGITAPIVAKGRTDTTGLGCTSLASNIQAGDSYREIAQKTARARYEAVKDIVLE